MTCSVCPLTVKLALKKVPGLSKTMVSFEKMEPAVPSDVAKTHLQALTQATANVGYPSTAKP